ncbi:unnamed protein product [Brachionus calyciflorus]|uniref:Uncharacterized protein n=1 Tax=Brachionus calyciflorus TaxID=104777 RepID=A0A814C6R5_9BILA|nr:unnamed protein product [Brachionus calyciflorus]
MMHKYIIGLVALSLCITFAYGAILSVGDTNDDIDEYDNDIFMSAGFGQPAILAVGKRSIDINEHTINKRFSLKRFFYRLFPSINFGRRKASGVIVG